MAKKAKYVKTKDTFKDCKENDILEKQQIDQLETIKKEIKTESKLPINELEKVYKKSIIKAICAIFSIIYFFLINLGYAQINNNTFDMILKILGFVELIAAIVLFEIAYKKDSDKIALIGIEILLFSISSLIIRYVSKNYSDLFKYIITIMGLIFAIYYITKMLISFYKLKKKIRMNLIKKNKEETR